MRAYHVLEEIVTFSSLIIHKDHTKLDYIPLSARKQQSRFREARKTLPTGLLHVGGEDNDAQQGDTLQAVWFSSTGSSCFQLQTGSLQLV